MTNTYIMNEDEENIHNLINPIIDKALDNYIPYFPYIMENLYNIQEERIIDVRVITVGFGLFFEVHTIRGAYVWMGNYTQKVAEYD